MREEKRYPVKIFGENKKSRKPLKIKAFGVVSGVPERTWTSDLPLRRRLRYPLRYRDIYKIFSSPIARLWVKGERSFVTLGGGRSIQLSYSDIYRKFFAAFPAQENISLPALHRASAFWDAANIHNILQYVGWFVNTSPKRNPSNACVFSYAAPFFLWTVLWRKCCASSRRRRGI